MEKMLHMKVGNNLGHVLLNIAQDAIIAGDIEKAMNTYRHSFIGMTDNYILDILKNKSVVITDEDGTSVNVVDEVEEIRKNESYMTDWNGFIKDSLDKIDMFVTYIKNLQEDTTQKTHHSVVTYHLDNDRDISKITALYISDYILNAPLNIHDKSVYEYYRYKKEANDIDELTSNELVCLSIMDYVDSIKKLFKYYCTFCKTYDFLITNGIVERYKKIENTISAVLNVLYEFIYDAAYYNINCDEYIDNMQNKMLDKILKTSFGNEYMKYGVIKCNIMDNYIAGWLAPDGSFFGNDGEYGDMIHMSISNCLHKYIGVDKKKCSNIDYELEVNGWMRIHENFVQFYPSDNHYIPTQEQMNKVKEYINKFHNGSICTNVVSKFGHEPKRMSDVMQMDKFALHMAFI